MRQRTPNFERHWRTTTKSLQRSKTKVRHRRTQTHTFWERTDFEKGADLGHTLNGRSSHLSVSVSVASHLPLWPVKPMSLKLKPCESDKAEQMCASVE